MTLDLGNTDKLNVLRDELKRIDIALLPPDVNRSGVEFTVETIRNGTDRGAIRYALAAIKNVGRQAMADVVADRELNGPFADEFDFAARLGGKTTNKRQLENLVRAGALDDLNPNRRQVFENVENLVRLGAQATSDRDSNQQSLFGEVGAELSSPTESRPDVADWPKMERLAQESEAVGLYLSAHPLEAFTERLKRLRVTQFADLAGSTPGSTVRLAGVVLDKQERTSAKGNRFAFVQLTDSSGQYEVVVFSELLTASRALLEPNSRVLLSAEARADGDGLRLNAQSVAPLDEALAEAAMGLRVFVAGTDGLESLKRTIADGEKGPGRISLVIDVGGQREVEIALPGRYALSGDMMAAIESAPGVTQVHEL